MPGRDERAERDQEDDQGQRHREEPGALEVVGERRVERLVRALAERPDVEGRVRLLHLGDASDDGVDLVGGVLGPARRSPSARAPSACRPRRSRCFPARTAT